MAAVLAFNLLDEYISQPVANKSAEILAMAVYVLMMTCKASVQCGISRCEVKGRE